MKLKLERPLIVFDFESTGVDTNKDRIVQIAGVKVNTDGTRETKNVLINPEIPIPVEASEVHGITDDMVKDAPTFKQLSRGIASWFDGCDVCGFNNDNYDNNLLLSEMDRVGVEFSFEGVNTVDVIKLYRELFPNTLEAIYKRLFKKELEGAHDALNDVTATLDVLEKILPKELKTAKQIDEFLQGGKKRVDMGGKMYEDENGDIRWNFSKNKDMLVTADKGFCDWFLRTDFPKESKNKLKEILNGQK